MHSFDPDVIRESVLRDGCFLCKGILSPEENDAYLAECSAFFDAGPRSTDKIFHPGCEDYVQPWMWDEQAGEYFNYRIHQFLHNQHSTTAESIFERIISLRAAVESPWPNAHYYDSHGHLDHVVITRYMPEIGFYPKHADDTSGHAFPLIQCLLLLTEPGVDFSGGDLTIYNSAGDVIRAQEDLGFSRGDCLFFDKRLEHEVATTAEVPGGAGRWAGIIGIKAIHRQPQPA